MFIFFGVLAIVFAILNIANTGDASLANRYRFYSMSMVALCLCAFYSDGASMVASGDIAGAMDVMPTVHLALWFCAIAAIMINGYSLFKGQRRS